LHGAVVRFDNTISSPEFSFSQKPFFKVSPCGPGFIYYLHWRLHIDLLNKTAPVILRYSKTIFNKFTSLNSKKDLFPLLKTQLGIFRAHDVKFPEIIIFD